MALPKITPTQITEIFRKSGPLLPVEVASKLGVDSFIAKAFLSQLLETNQAKVTQQRVGNEFLYFIPGQEAAARARLQTFNVKAEPTASNYGPVPTATPALQKKQEQFLDRLKDIEAREIKDKKSKSVLPITVEDVRSLFIEKPVAVGGEIISKLKDMKVEPEVVKQVKEIIEEVQEDIGAAKPRIELIEPKIAEIKDTRPALKATGEKIYSEGTGVIQAIGYLTGIGGNIISKELKRRGKDAEIVIEIDSAVGPMRMLAVVRDKKHINDGDLSVAYNTGIDMKLPVLFLTKGKLTKKAEDYVASIDLLTLKKIGE